jgi:hypothetical protein
MTPTDADGVKSQVPFRPRGSETTSQAIAATVGSIRIARPRDGGYFPLTGPCDLPIER